MPKFEQWRNHKDIYSVGDKLDVKTVQAIQNNSGVIMVMTDQL